ncbi:MAG: CPCC family cysteine-rich protein [Polyangiaceae bacterium]
MRQKISRADAVRLIARAREAVCEPAHLQDVIDDWQEPNPFEALLQEYAGVTNGFLSQVVSAICATRIEVVGKPEERLPCPCCQRKTLTEVFDLDDGTGFDICDYCGWEDDGTKDPAAGSGPNHGSMLEYRERIAANPDSYACEKWASARSAAATIDIDSKVKEALAKKGARNANKPLLAVLSGLIHGSKVDWDEGAGEDWATIVADDRVATYVSMAAPLAIVEQRFFPAIGPELSARGLTIIHVDDMKTAALRCSQDVLVQLTGFPVSENVDYEHLSVWDLIWATI